MISKILRRLLKGSGYVIVKSHDQFKYKSDPFLDQEYLMKGTNNLIIFDVGAHYGESVVKYLKHFKNSKIYSFEPFEDSFKILNETVKNETNVETLNIALGNLVGFVDFHINKSSATNSILPTHKNGSITWSENLLDTLVNIKVPSSTIDDFVEKKGIDKIDILKLDTQGTEYLIIEGARETIKKGRIRIVYMEIIILPTYQGQKYFDEILLLMRVNGFKLFKMYDFSFNRFGELRQVDAVFISNDFKFS